MSDPTETVLVVDRRNRILGTRARGEVRRLGLIYRASYILVFNSAGELFIQRRALHKDTHPGIYDAAAGGVLRQGETYETNALRELQEELGIPARPLQTLFDFYFQGGSNRVWGRAFTVCYDGPIEFTDHEVTCGEFLSPDRVFDRARKQPFTPDTLQVLERFRRNV